MKKISYNKYLKQKFLQQTLQKNTNLTKKLTNNNHNLSDKKTTLIIFPAIYHLQIELLEKYLKKKKNETARE